MSHQRALADQTPLVRLGFLEKVVGIIERINIICPMYGIFTNISPKNHPNVDKYSMIWEFFPMFFPMVFPHVVRALNLGLIAPASLGYGCQSLRLVPSCISLLQFGSAPWKTSGLTERKELAGCFTGAKCRE